jgi:hypothetical protein
MNNRKMNDNDDIHWYKINQYLKKNYIAFLSVFASASEYNPRRGHGWRCDVGHLAPHDTESRRWNLRHGYDLHDRSRGPRLHGFVGGQLGPHFHDLLVKKKKKKSRSVSTMPFARYGTYIFKSSYQLSLYKNVILELVCHYFEVPRQSNIISINVL